MILFFPSSPRKENSKRKLDPPVLSGSPAPLPKEGMHIKRTNFD
jgi:hypothetical protein